MATNMSTRDITSTSIEVRAWYQGTTWVSICEFYCDGVLFETQYYGEGSGLNQTNWTTFYETKYNLSPNREYRFYARFYTNNRVFIEATGNFYYTTDVGDVMPNIPSPYVYELSETDVMIAWDSDINAYEYYMELESRDDYSYDETYWSRSTSAVFSGLLPDTRYRFRIRAYSYGDNPTSFSSYLYFTTDAPPRPSNWNWEYNIVSGGAFYSQSSKTVYLMRASHWNNFIDRINEFREYKLGTGSSIYITPATTSTTEAGIRSCINQAINAINDMLPSSSRMSNIYQGDIVAASIFINLRDKLNSIL